MPLTNEVQLLVERQAAGILHVTTVDTENKGAHTPLRRSDDFDLSIGFKVDTGGLLALAQIGDGFFMQMPGNAIRHAAADAATIEPQHQAGLLGRSAMHERIDAQRAVQPGQLGGLALEIIEARPPDQRAVAEDPEIIADGHQGECMGCDRAACSRNSPKAAMQWITQRAEPAQSEFSFEELS